MSTQPIYLDHAATTPLDPGVLSAMLPYLESQFYNPSAQYAFARNVKKDIDAARVQIAHYIGARPSELFFTAGGTEANNLAIKGVMDQYPDAHMIVSAVEHDSVLEPAAKYNATHAPVTPDGRIDLKLLAAAITDHTVLISVQYANNEIGTLQPLTDIAQVISQVLRNRKASGNSLPLLFHTDACQAPAYLDIHSSRLGVDLMTISASKIYGPKQIGALYVRSSVTLLPQMLGGGQERGLRSGTESAATIVGFATAMAFVQDRRKDEAARVAHLQRLFVTQLETLSVPITVNGSLSHRIANNVHITIPGYDNETLMMQLDDRGIMCAVGSACSASNDEPSHVLTAIGLSDEQAQSSLRFTLGNSTTEADIQQVIEILRQLL